MESTNPLHPLHQVMKREKRRCFVVLHSSYVEGQGYIPSLAIEGESGHYPMSGRTDDQLPWYWGPDYDTAQATADDINERRFGLSPTQAARIVASSMAASRI